MNGHGGHDGHDSRDDLEAVRRRLEGVDEIPLEHHPDLFEEVHASLSAALARLEEV